MAGRLYESHIEEAALSWFQDLGYEATSREEIAPEARHAECDSFAELVLVQRLRDALLPKLLSVR